MADTISSDSVAQDQILAFVQRIERIESEVKDLNSDKAEIYAEAKGNGFDTKALKIVVARRRMDLSERMELEAIVELYEAALGMYSAPSQREDDAPRTSRARAHVETIDEFDADGVLIEPGNSAGSATTVQSNTPDTPVVASHSEPPSNSTDAPTSPGAAEDVAPGSSAPITGGDHANSGGKAVASQASTATTFPSVATGGGDIADEDGRRENLAAYEGEGGDAVLSPANSPRGDAAEGTGGVTHHPLVPALDPEELYAAAVEHVIVNGRASQSLLQRLMAISFDTACELIERMEREGVVRRSEAGFLEIPPHKPIGAEHRVLN